jgi:hypothetical protein
MSMMFEQTETGYRATDETIDYWMSRTSCLGGCGTILDPVKTEGGYHHYDCHVCWDAMFTEPVTTRSEF